MRETRQSGSEGGGAAFIRLPLPLSPEIRTAPKIVYQLDAKAALRRRRARQLAARTQTVTHDSEQIRCDAYCNRSRWSSQ
jgi:hypothetical protein